MGMLICPICHGNGFVAREPNESSEYPETTYEEGKLTRISFSTTVKGCDRCMNRGEIPD
jgi:hypothetical protein